MARTSLPIHHPTASSAPETASRQLMPLATYLGKARISQRSRPRTTTGRLSIIRWKTHFLRVPTVTTHNSGFPHHQCNRQARCAGGSFPTLCDAGDKGHYLRLPKGQGLVAGTPSLDMLDEEVDSGLGLPLLERRPTVLSGQVRSPKPHVRERRTRSPGR